MVTTLIEEFFYIKASDRIRERVDDSGLKHSEIYKPDHKQISRIINNDRPKNNRFLICDAVLGNSYLDDETGKFVECGLLPTKKLNFSSKAEILWGSQDEISSYLHDLFVLLWEEVTKDRTYNIDSELYLCDYVPYAKYSTYWNILFDSPNTYPAILYGIYEDTVIENINSARMSALDLLYKNCYHDFNEAFTSFTHEIDSFHKLDKTIKEKLIGQLFLPIIQNHMPNTASLGLRVRDLIYADLSNIPYIIINHAELNNEEYIKHLIHASSTYILALEQIQAKLIKEMELT